MTLKEQVIERYFTNKYNFDTFKEYMAKEIMDSYEHYHDWIGFDWSIEDIREPFSTTTDYTDKIITIHYPKCSDFTGVDVKAWIESEGFEYTVSNFQRGWRIRI